MVDPELLEDLRRLVNALMSPRNSQWDSGDPWVQRSLGACPDDLMKAIVADNRGGPSTYSSPLPKASQQSEAMPQNRSGWVDPVPLRSPEGLEHVDRLVDQQDRLDAAARARQLGLSHEEWARLSEKDLKDRQARMEKAAKDRKETPK
jgi:hypothetical protein